jgi:hypothetical protein
VRSISAAEPRCIITVDTHPLCTEGFHGRIQFAERTTGPSARLGEADLPT